MNARARFWIVTLATVLGVGTTASLGRWQLARAAQKEALLAQIARRAQEPVLTGQSLIGAGDPTPLLHRRVQARGQWISQHTVFLDNRQMHGQPGFFVLTPLRLEGSATIVLVQRGWVARDFEDRARLPRIDTPTGTVLVSAQIVPPPSRLFEFARQESGAIRQNLDLGEYAAETGLALRTDLSLQQGGSAADGLLRDWPVVGLGVERHYGYAWQWFGLSALMAVLYVWFQIVKRFTARRAG